MSTAVERAREAANLLRIIKAGDVIARYTKDDVGSGDLATGGGLKAPAQGLPAPGAKKPHGVVAKTVDFQGMPVHVDRPRGHVQTGTGDDGKIWKRIYHVDYGFVPNTQGGDGEDVDVYLGLDNEAQDAHWILQKKADGTFDEYKVMLGFPEADMAKGMYQAHTPKKFFGGIATTSVGMMKALLGLQPSETLKALTAFVRGVDELPKEEKSIGAGLSDRRVQLVLGADGAAKSAAISSEQRYLLGIVLEPEVVDAQGDIYSADEVRKSEWEYMVNFRNVGLMHKGLLNGRVRLVESYCAPVAMTIGGSTIKAGTWLMGLHIPDDSLWEQVKAGGLTGLSIGGFARKSPPTT